jgi:hypothetical protein
VRRHCVRRSKPTADPFHYAVATDDGSQVLAVSDTVLHRAQEGGDRARLPHTWHNT